MNQIPLLNTNLMASHQELARIVMERRLSEYNSGMIAAGNSPVPAAAAPVDSATTLPCGSPGSETGLLNKRLRTPLPQPETGEFNLPDEDRNFVLSKLPKCPGCGACYPVMLKRQKNKRPAYRLACYAIIKRIWSAGDCLTTDWLPTSQQAIAVWTMVARLSK